MPGLGACGKITHKETGTAKQRERENVTRSSIAGFWYCFFYGGWLSVKDFIVLSTCVV